MPKLSVQTTAQLVCVYSTIQYSPAILPASNCAAGNVGIECSHRNPSAKPIKVWNSIETQPWFLTLLKGLGALMQHPPEIGEKWTILPNSTFWAFQDKANTNIAYSRAKILEIQTCLHTEISGKCSMNKNTSVISRNGSRSLIKNCNSTELLEKKNLQGHVRQLFLYSSRKNRGVENFFILQKRKTQERLKAFVV